MAGATKLVCFGDQLNDVSMFEITDEKYAVANAHPKLKEMATKVIGGNDEKGVAAYLKQLCSGGC